jgi:DNA-binding PadR family transcriptional regulator
MRQELTIAHIEECFGGIWFSLDEAWINLFSRYGVEEFGRKMTREDMIKVLDRLERNGFIRTVGELGPLSREYQLTEKAGNFQKKVPPQDEAPKLPGTLGQRLDEYEKALEREMRQEGRDPTLDDPRRKAEWITYGRLNKAMKKRARHH